MARRRASTSGSTRGGASGTGNMRPTRNLIDEVSSENGTLDAGSDSGDQTIVLGEQTTPNRRGTNHLEDAPVDPKNRKWITIDGDRFSPVKVARTLGELCHKYVHGPWLTWKEVEEDERKDMWLEFQARYQWKDDTAYVKRIFEKRCRIHWATTMYNGKKDQMAELETSDINDLKDKNPYWCNIDVWNALVKEWNTEKFQKKSKRGSQNRKSEKFGSITKHTCGSIPLSVHAKKLEIELGRKPNPIELFTYTHAKRQKGETSSTSIARKEFIDGKSHAIHDAYEENIVEKFGSNPETQPSFDCDSWFKPTGGLTKGRLYGFGQGDSALELIGSKELPSNESEQAATQLKESLEAKFQEKVLAIEDERRKEREEMEILRQKDKDEMDSKIEAMKKMMFEMLGNGGHPQA